MFETLLAHTVKLEDSPMTCGECEDRKNCCWLHNASHLAQSSHGICEEMKRATTKGGVEKLILEWKASTRARAKCTLGMPSFTV